MSMLSYPDRCESLTIRDSREWDKEYDSSLEEGYTPDQAAELADEAVEYYWSE